MHTDKLVQDLELFPHELDRIAKEFFANGLLSDMNLAEFDHDLSEYDVKRRIAAEVGHIMTIHVVKQTGESFGFEITPETTLQQLKEEIQTLISKKEEVSMGSRKISWKYTWKNYSLTFNNQKLLENKRALFEYGIRNGAKLFFTRVTVICILTDVVQYKE